MSMAINDLLLSELDAEARKTRKVLERVPPGRADFVPHAKSMPLGKLAAHLAQLGSFGNVILTTPGLDFSTAGFKPLAFESPEQLVRVFDGHIAQVRSSLAAAPADAWEQPWVLRSGPTVFMDARRFDAYRALFLNHIVHHRAQLGVYLRLLDVPVPSTYGPSADEPM